MPPPNKATGVVERLAKADTDMLKAWITEGAKWPEESKLIARKKEGVVDAGKEKKVVAEVFAKITTTTKKKNPGEMQPYTSTIAGTDVTFDMVPIPGGKFKMGSPDSEPGHKPDEGPVHEVEIAPFWMQQCEVTWNAFELFMYPNEEKLKRERRNSMLDLMR
jgi:formylglycine-generating enzyme required for sulfatase activity